MTRTTTIESAPTKSDQREPLQGMRRPDRRRAWMHVISILAAVLVSLPIAEGLIRLRNRSMTNYNIEMWRYSKELKTTSSNPVLGHEHVPNRSAILQSASIRLNELGMRGDPIPPLTPGKRRILLLGSSITLGWGVREENTMTTRLHRMFLRDGNDVEVLNAGIGNYNAVRYVELFLTKLRGIEPTDIVVHYFINDAEVLTPGGGNFLIRHSQLAASAWTLVKKLSMGTGQAGLNEHYRRVYEPGGEGVMAMENALQRLSDYAREHDVRLYLAMTPDVQNLTDYPFTYIHERMQKISGDLGYRYVDLLPGFEGLTPDEIWSIPGDPHPNALGHEIMATALYPILADTARDVPAHVSSALDP